MLKELSLRNYLLLEDLHLEFPPGFSVITGETGSGKSVLLEGLRIVLGQSISRDELRNPDKKAYFELIYEDDREILALSREIFPSGRSISRINGEITNLAEVRKIFGPRIDFYGQRDDSLLLHKSNQQRLIFDYGYEELSCFLDEFEALSKLNEEISRELAGLRDLSQLEREALEGQLRELSQLGINLEEDRELEENFQEIINSKDILEKLEASKTLLEDETLPGLYRLQDIILTLEHFSKQGQLSSRLEALGYELEDIREEIQASLHGVALDEALIEEKERRYLELQDVKKRYQRDLEELVHYRDEISEILDRNKRREEIRVKLEEKRVLNLRKYHEVSRKLRDSVRSVFEKLSLELKEALGLLELKEADFDLEIEERDPETIHIEGHYRFSILASMNRGKKLRPMGEVLSGGEMSRLMLALKSISNKGEVLVFDEIDSGISGRVAHQVAREIKKLSRDRQILAISHLPQLVAFADEHFFLEKHQGSSQILRLDAAGHVEKLANMMSAQINEASLETARKMIARAKGEVL